MVWGMNLPSGFGEFWPLGEFEGEAPSGRDGWGARLQTHYEERMPEKRRALFESSALTSYAGYVANKLKSECGTTPLDLGSLPFTPVEPQEPPKSFVTEKTYKTLGSLIALNFGLLAIDEALKELIERLEPSVHQFFPIDIIMPKGIVFTKQYYVLFIGQWFSSFLSEKSGPTSENRTKYAFLKAAFGDAHLWRDRRTPAITCFSDQLQAEIVEAGLRLPKLYKMKEV